MNSFYLFMRRKVLYVVQCYLYLNGRTKGKSRKIIGTESVDKPLPLQLIRLIFNVFFFFFFLNVLFRMFRLHPSIEFERNTWTKSTWSSMAGFGETLLGHIACCIDCHFNSRCDAGSWVCCCFLFLVPIIIYISYLYYVFYELMHIDLISKNNKKKKLISIQ